MPKIDLNALAAFANAPDNETELADEELDEDFDDEGMDAASAADMEDADEEMDTEGLEALAELLAQHQDELLDYVDGVSEELLADPMQEVSEEDETTLREAWDDVDDEMADAIGQHVPLSMEAAMYVADELAAQGAEDPDRIAAWLFLMSGLADEGDEDEMAAEGGGEDFTEEELDAELDAEGY